MSLVTASRKIRRLAASAAVFAASVACAAQERLDRPTESFLQQQRVIDDKLAEDRARIAPMNEFFDLQYGGWFDYYVFHYADGVQKSRVYQRPGLSVWARVRADDGAHEAFARLRLSYNYFNPGDQYERQQDWEGPNFDRAWYQIDVGRALRLNEPSDPLQLSARIGRQEVLFGTGYALDMPLDAILLDGRIDDFRIRGLISKTIASTPNVDRSEPVDSHSNRHFYGVELAYEGFQNHRPFAYAVWNQDHTDERPQDYFQEYSYDTQYWGFGSRGSLARNLTYWTEWVFETGRSYGSGMFLRRDYVDAWAWDAGLEYLFDHPMRPRVGFEYMFASGDPDRHFSPTSAQGGNTGGREDTSFVGFGFRDTGIALGIVPSNIHIWKLGGSFTPFAGDHTLELLRDFELGTNWFLYHKNRSTGAISDPTADMYSGNVGWEMDYFVNWRLASDISWTARWGVFFPGDAYSDRDTRHFFLTGITWSF